MPKSKHGRATPSKHPARSFDSFEAVRWEFPNEIACLAAALRERKVLSKVDSTRYRHGVSRDLVESKLAEVIFNAFRLLESISAGRKQAVEFMALAEKAGDDYRRAARDLRRVDPLMSHAAAHKAGVFDQTLERLKDLDHQRPIQETLDDLTVDLCALLIHTTTLSRYYVLTEIIPEILAAAFSCWPTAHQGRGTENPSARYKRIIKRWVTPKFTEANILSRRRTYLFAGDRRFSPDLFNPHRPIRTVSSGLTLR
jgi:hypothetical protein